jgi:hypothetical protein
MTSRWHLVLLFCCLGAAAPAQDLHKLVDRRFEAVRATRRESQWRLIPWRPSLTAALAEAKKTNKPVYMFCADGIWQTGNC